MKIQQIWSIAIYEVSNSVSICNIKDYKILKKFISPKLSFKLSSVIMKADPFLYSDNKCLYLFYEQMIRGSMGSLFMVSTFDLQHWSKPKEVLKEKFHLSFPFVFEDNEKHYMIPESGQNKSIRLYYATEFPNKWNTHKILLKGEKFVDTSIIKEGNYYFLFTTTVNQIEKNITYKLKLYTSSSLDSGWKEHPNSPISESMKTARCGGSIFRYNNNLFRPAQDCEKSYGKNISIFKIIHLSPTKYEEQLICENIFDHKNNFFSLGGHHFNPVQFKNKTLIAVDGLRSEFWLNTIFQNLFIKPINCFLSIK